MSSASPWESTAPSLPAVQCDPWSYQAVSNHAGSSCDSDQLGDTVLDNVHVGQEDVAVSDSEAEDGTRYRRRRQRIHFNVAQLQTVYHLPLKTAAERLGICEAALKRICRRNRIIKWPYRQLSSVRRRIAELKDRRATMLAGGDHARSPGQLEGQEQLVFMTPAQFTNKLRQLEEEHEQIVRSTHRRHRQGKNIGWPSTLLTQHDQQLLPRPMSRETLAISLPRTQSNDLNCPSNCTRLDRDFPLLLLANVCEAVRAYK